MIACAPLPPAPSPTTSRTPHFVEHRPRQTVLRQRYNLAQSKHAVACCWRWRRTYFTLREDAEHAEVLVCIDTEIARHLTRSKHAIGACLGSSGLLWAPLGSSGLLYAPLGCLPMHNKIPQNSKGHLQHHDMNSFSEPTTAKASFYIIPKEIIELSKMPSFTAINFAFRS